MAASSSGANVPRFAVLLIRAEDGLAHVRATTRPLQPPPEGWELKLVVGPVFTGSAEFISHWRAQGSTYTRGVQLATLMKFNLYAPEGRQERGGDVAVLDVGDEAGENEQ